MMKKLLNLLLQKKPENTAQSHIRSEQIKLLAGNLGSSVIPGILVAMLMVYALRESADLQSLLIWCACVVVSKLVDIADARAILRRQILAEQIDAIRRRLIILHGLDGAAWGSLALIALDTASPGTSILIIGVLSGIAGNSMSILSPVLPVFISFCTIELGILAIGVGRLNDPSLQILSVAALFYISTLLIQARNSARAAHAAISLRYENMDLIRRLQVESKRTQDALHKEEQANAAKSKFLAAASHDLRQPIHAQGLFLEVLGATSLTSAQQSLVSNIRHAASNCAEMLHTLLDYSRIEAGVVEPVIRPFLLQPLLNKIEQEMAHQAQAKGIVYRSRETRAAALGDLSMTELILRNLVSNAIRYTEQGGILIACRVRQKTLVLEVWDTGIGIPKEQHDEVFGEFHQLGNPERDHRKGLGLGLAIAQGLSRLQGFPLTLRSIPGRGSVFKIEMPLAVTVAGVETEVVRPMPSTKIHRLAGLRILFIDDDQRVRTSMAQLLQSWHCESVCVESVEEATLAAKEQPFDLVISDYRLREQRNGTEAIEAVTAVIGKPIAALLITGDTAPARLREARTSGITLLHKPVSPEQLRDELLRVVEQKSNAS